jgi:hypothetical protein
LLCPFFSAWFVGAVGRSTRKTARLPALHERCQPGALAIFCDTPPTHPDYRVGGARPLL